MKKIWNTVKTLRLKNEYKNKLFILLSVVEYCLIGGLIWLVLGKIYFPGISWLLCFIGYPGIFIGFFGSILYLYRHDLNK